MNRPQDRLLPVVVAAPQDSGSQDSVGRERVERAAARGGAGRGSRPFNPYAAQMFGQTEQRRGLRGGAPVLDAARSAYLGAEFSGENDRRPSSGLILKKAI